MSEILKVIILGIIEGITEFLPISSTGHLILVENYLKIGSIQFQNAFTIIIQLGAILSVLVIYFNKLYPLEEIKTKTGKKLLLKKQTMDLWIKMVIGVIPAVILGSLFDKVIEEYLFNKFVIAIALIFYGIVIIIMENKEKGKQTKINTIKDLSLKMVFLIGLFQCLAMVPGTSRSAVTIIGAILLGCSRNVATEFSFFLAIPTMLGATAKKVLGIGLSFSANEWFLIILGMIVSFIVAYGVIIKFLDYIRKHDFKIFGVYRIILGIIVLLISMIH